MIENKTVKEVREPTLPVFNPVPNFAEIKMRMAQRFTATAPLVYELVIPCAEVAERMLYTLKELLHESYKEQFIGVMEAQYSERKVHIKRMPAKRPDRRSSQMYYWCPDCKRLTIRFNHKYCPQCGAKIVWRNA